VIPRTASAGQDPKDTISHKGIYSQDINFASCANTLPPPATIGSLYTSHLQAALTGAPSALLGGLCSGQNLGDDIARGYITVDTVNSCSTQFPGDPGYFTTRATFQNVLWGDYFHVNSAENFAQGDVLVHIEAASASYSGNAYTAFAPGEHTFYGRYVAANATDNRESLPSIYGARYLNGGSFTGGTQFNVWRDSTTPNSTGFKCSSGAPAWYPLGMTEVVVFDEQENPVTQQGCSVSPCPVDDPLAIPAEAQKVVVGSENLPVDQPFGWIFMNFNTSVPAGGVYADGYAQAFVSNNMDASGRFSVGLSAVSLNQLCGGNIADITIP
jgi:hypothetical protein